MHRDFSLASPRPLTCCPSLYTAFAFLLFRAQRFVHSPAVLIFPFLFAPLHCSADPSFWGALFPAATGVGLRQQRMLRCRSSSDPPVRLCRGESHSGASPALSPLLPGRLRACLPSVFFRAHSHALPALVPFSLPLLRIRVFAVPGPPVPAIPPFPLRHIVSQGAVISGRVRRVVMVILFPHT